MENKPTASHDQTTPWRLREMDLAPTRVVLAEDHERVRQGIRALLEKTPDIEVVAEASNGLDAIHLTEELRDRKSVV